MIPKVINYCWFGNNPLPARDQKCIESWKKFCPDYEIKVWNESNFDLNCCDYVKEAVAKKKWAFVSDFARYWILYNYGGLYFDTDVEIIKPLDEIVDKGAFIGTEHNGGINPGLGIGAESNMEIFRNIIDFYMTEHYILPDGTINSQNIVSYTTRIFKERGWSDNEEIQSIDGVIVYPPEYFCPMNNDTGKIKITENTYSIHHYSASWQSWSDKLIIRIERCSNKKSILYRIKRGISLPMRVLNKVEKTGLKKTVAFAVNKIKHIFYR